MKVAIKILFCYVLLHSSSVSGQRDTIYAFGDETSEVEYFFGFNLIPSAMGGLIHFALVKPGPNNVNTIKQLTKDGFISQASGWQKSIANPNSKNFFKQYLIDNPNIVDDLWRLRYKEYPYYTMDPMQPGWSANDSIPFLPSDGQMKTLAKFGLYKLSDYIYGENAFKLLYLISRQEWLNTYKVSH